MSNSLVSIQLSEWQECTPDEVPALKGCFLDEPTGGHAVAKFLNDSGKLSLVELRSGLHVSAYSHVGRIRVGNLDITVLPKLGAQALLRLLHYAFGFRQLDFLADSIHVTDRLTLYALPESDFGSQSCWHSVTTTITDSSSHRFQVLRIYAQHVACRVDFGRLGGAHICHCKVAIRGDALDRRSWGLFWAQDRRGR
ncbi:hypothetical protein C5Y97_24515 [Blastopirellula marina]|uniref:Uncharacterized protein n=1 Tax=Blastopirellula marina TaxID=124 RepID=A0A2S8FAG8_9BACT|nr:hypothetical protein C5Y98_24500 [Blastopirellula marina]PTL42197.1 hypothetical protein C5Y97_24515 [Blastopirellula marina]